MGRRDAVRRKLRLPRASGALALYRPDKGGAAADGGEVRAGSTPEDHRHRRRLAGRIDVAAPETFPCVFPLRQGRPAPAPPATLVFSLGLAPSFARMGGAGGARSPGQLLGSVIRICRARCRDGFNRASTAAVSASIVSARTGSIASASTTASTASASIALPGISFSSAAWVAAVGADGARSRFRLRPPSQSLSATRAGDHQHRRRSRSGRRRRRVRRLRHPQAELRQQRQICRRAPNPAVLIKRGRARPLRAGLLLR